MAKRSTNSREAFKTRNDVFDQFTIRNIFKLSSQGYFDEMASPISIGKESNVFSAKKSDGSKVILKIYRLETCDFNKMYQYIRDDPRFQNTKKNRRKVIFTWAKREYRNLLKAREANVKAPIPFTVFANILIMQFIGADDAAPKLKDAHPDNPKKFFDDVVRNMKNLFKAGFVHTDLSEFNILNDNNLPVLIDFSHATPVSNYNSKEYLARDIKNIVRFFKKLGVKTTEEAVFRKITKP